MIYIVLIPIARQNDFIYFSNIVLINIEIEGRYSNLDNLQLVTFLKTITTHTISNNRTEKVLKSTRILVDKDLFTVAGVRRIIIAARIYTI